MKHFLTILLATILIAASSYSQNFTKVVEIVGTLEDSMTVKFDREQRIRSSEISSISTELNALKKLLTNMQQAGDTTSRSILERLELLETKSNDTNSTTSVAGLTHLLDQLVSELKKEIENGTSAQQNAAAVKPTVMPVQFSGQVFSYFVYSTSGKEGKDFNRFDLDRVYLTAKAPVFENGKFQLTTDLFRSTGAYRHPDSISKLFYGGFVMRIKFAFIDYAPMNYLSVKFGLIPTVWTGFVDGVWKYRGISATISDLQAYYPTSDLGLSVSYALPGKLGDVSAFVLNGSGFTSMETNRYKDIALRANIFPFVDEPLLKTLLVAGYVYNGSNLSTVSTALPRDRFGALIGYSYSVASAAIEYNSRNDAPIYADTLIHGTAVSLFGEVKAPLAEWREKISLLWRYDVTEPNDEKGGDVTRFAILGLMYKPYEKLLLSIDRQWTDAETKTMKQFDNVKINYDNRWFFHVIINF